MKFASKVVAALFLWLCLGAKVAESAGRSLAGVLSEPGSCFNVTADWASTASGMLIPIDKVLGCLQKVRLDTGFAVGAVEAYRDAFKAGYGYYFYNSDPLDSDPLKNPYGWEIYNGTSGGQVNYDKEFKKLIEDIKKNGGADGTLAYKISDILTQARDAHTDQVSWDLGTLSLVQASSDPAVWLNLRLKEGTSSDVEVVGNVVGPNGTGVAETKVVSTINGEDAFEFLKELSSNTAIGIPSQFRSPGVRMNYFLGSQRTDDNFVRWSPAIPSAGDISRLPSRLEIQYDDGSSTTWAFTINVPKNLAFLPIGELQQYLNTPAGGSNGPLALYENMIEGKPTPKQKMTRARTNSGRRDVAPRDYYIYPGYQDNNTNLLGFTVFKDRSVDPPVPFSGYTVVNGDTMVWKLPTFENPNSLEDVINFWNVMVTEAKERNIKKLIIDISDNGGGSIANAYTAVALLYPDAPFEDAVHWYTTRISDMMLTLGRDALPEFEGIMEALSLDENKDILVSFVNATDVGDLQDAFGSMLTILTNAAYLAVSTGNCGADDFSITTLVKCLNNGGNDENWINVNYESLSDLLDTANDFLNSDEGLEDGIDSNDIDDFFFVLDSLRDSINRPNYCQNVNETCKTQTNEQGGVQVLSSDYFRSAAIDKDVIRQVREFSRGNPFESYVLISNSQLVGSAANIFESALRHISKKYNESMPKTTGVSLGCLGDASQCDMTSFQGQIVKGNRFIGSLYAMYGALSALQQFLNLLPDSVVTELQGISKQDIKDYNKAVEKYLTQLPKPPSISSELPQFNSVPIYSLEIPRQTIPQEFFNRPPDEYLPIWPAPGSVTFDNQQSLPLIYEELQQFF